MDCRIQGKRQINVGKTVEPKNKHYEMKTMKLFGSNNIQESNGLACGQRVIFGT